MKHRTLQNLLTQMIHAVLASPLVLGASCGGVDVSSFDAPKCVAGSLSVEGLQPATPVDYIELRVLGIPRSEQVVTSTGTMCQLATNVPACTAAVADPMIPAGATGFSDPCSQICVPLGLLTTKGDAVTVIASKPALDQFLAPYDTEQEAVFAALSTNQTVDCSDKNQGAVRQVPGGFEVVTSSGTGCGSGNPVIQHKLFVDPKGAVTELSNYTLMAGAANCSGRRPFGLHPRSWSPRSEAGPLARHFVASAHLEAAASLAFRALHAELVAHRAPPRLQRLAARSARDETRHARITKRLARRYGGRPRPPSVQRSPVRPIEDLARENAVEGCVRETYGALVIAWQARRAKDPAIARAMARIARDEVRHASLAWQVAAGAETRLSAAAQARVAAARGAAINELRAELLMAPAPELVATAGVPSTHDALALLEKLEQHLHFAEHRCRPADVLFRDEYQGRKDPVPDELITL